MSNILNNYTYEDPETGITAFLCVESNKNTKYTFGGMRVNTSVTLSEVKELQDNMYLKLALHGSQVGAAKAGVKANPDDSRLPVFFKNFGRHFSDKLKNGLVLGKDMGASQWMLDEIYKSIGMTQVNFNDSVTILKDLNGYFEGMTGTGVFWCAREVYSDNFEGSTFSVQGVGAVGRGFLKQLASTKAKLLSVSDKNISVSNLDGIDIDALLSSIDADNTINEEKAKLLGTINPSEFTLTVKVDTVVLAAGSYTVNSGTAAKMSANNVLEAANMAVTDNARVFLARKGILVIPDICCNSTSANLVAKQLDSGNSLSHDNVWALIESRIVEIVNKIIQAHRYGMVFNDSKALAKAFIINGVTSDSENKKREQLEKMI